MENVARIFRAPPTNKEKMNKEKEQDKVAERLKALAELTRAAMPAILEEERARRRRRFFRKLNPINWI